MTTEKPTNERSYQPKLALANDEAVDRWWETIYHQRFNNISFIARNKGDGLGQRIGIDTVIGFQSGHTLNIDEKVRTEFWSDVLIEFDSARAKGWIEKQLMIDYIAYGFLKERIAFFFPWALLQQAWFNNKDSWLSDYRTIVAKNEGYVTKSVAIPLETLSDAIQKVMFGL